MLDTYKEHSSDAPWNKKELPKQTELEQQQDWNMELCTKIHVMKLHLSKLKEIEESFKTFGFLSYEETTIKNNILNKY